MKKALLLLATLSLATLGFAGTHASKSGDAWMTDVDAAMAKAKAENKVLLMDFTGSDWCIWCKRLDGEVFSTQQFNDYAAEHLVLLKVDFPRSVPQSDEVKKANRALLEKYGIEGFPTVIVLNSEGEKIGEMGYQDGGPATWLKSLTALTSS